MNDWIREGAPVDSNLAAVAVGTTAAGTLRAGDAGHPLVGYFETADAVETARNSGKWKVDGTANKYTSDGVHPNALGHQTMADASVAQWPTVF